ncbi:MAG TPA: cytochrome c-type biogenesis protein CcmH, partial [Thermomicrobiaceae bacterium]|nr:cytochrome c-type biogenesis protein CcmH [Thermomicrobiaceae bacterium]
MLLAALVVLLALVLAPTVALADETLSPEALSIANSLNCPVCEGLSVRDSTSQLSGEMRQLIQTKLDQGETRQQIMDYFVHSYGVGILREPPKQGIMGALWLGPIVGLVLGAVLLGAFVLQRRGRSPGPGAGAD